MIIIKTYWKHIVIVVLIAVVLLGIIYVISLDYSSKVGAASIVVSAAFAILFSDVAGTLALRRFQEEDAKRARITALQSLLNEVARARLVVKRYLSEKPTGIKGFPRMPVTSFETAFVSGSLGLDAEELVKAVSKYLVHADSVNSLIETKLAKPKEDPKIKEACAPLPEVLDRLNNCLKRALES